MRFKRLAAAFLDDVIQRRGWRQEWDGFDSEVQAAIRASFEHRARHHLEDAYEAGWSAGLAAGEDISDPEGARRFEEWSEGE